MGAYEKGLRCYQHSKLQIFSHRIAWRRRCFAAHHACWLATPSPSWWRFSCDWASTLETGGTRAILVGHDIVDPLIHGVYILEGCIWFAIATAAELPQVVSLARFILLFFSSLIPVLRHRCL